MYAYLKGKVTDVTPTTVVLETAAGIAFELRVPLSTSSQLSVSEQGQQLFTYFYVNREGEQTLFGFLSEREKAIFAQLVSVSGVGPSTALAFLSSLNADEIINAIAQGDLRTIKSVKGIGAKTAERVILELRDKMSKEKTNLSPTTQTANYNTVSSKNIAEALEALIHLGIPKISAEKNIQSVLQQNGDKLSTEAIIRLALKTK